MTTKIIDETWVWAKINHQNILIIISNLRIFDWMKMKIIMSLFNAFDGSLLGKNWSESKS
jgi:hypothetical protein